MGEPEQPLVTCVDCRRPCKSPVSRARRVGAKCWRKRRAKARAQATPVPLPGLSDRGSQAGQDGLDLRHVSVLGTCIACGSRCPNGVCPLVGAVWTPADGADTTVTDAVGDAAPAPAPSPASPGDGAGVTPAEDVDEPRLTVAQIGRLRAVFAWARARLAVHPRNAEGRGKPYTLGLEYAPREPTPPVHPDVARRGRAEHVEVCWEAGQVDIVYRSDRYEIDTAVIYPADVDQAIDLLCAFGILPGRLSRQYAAGVQAGLRGGDAIDGDLAATS